MTRRKEKDQEKPAKGLSRYQMWKISLDVIKAVLVAVHILQEFIN